MMRLHRDVEMLKAKGIKLLVVCPEDEKGVEKFTKDFDFGFDFVADHKHTLADKYNQQVKILKFGRMPAQIVLNKDLEVVYSHYAKNMKDIVEEREIFSELL